MFNADEVQAIQEIPISNIGVPDKLVWTASKDGQYSVRTGYQVARLCKSKTRGDEGSSLRRDEEDRNLWKGIWNMNIKKKIQHFIWRVCHNRIPVNSSLRKRGIELDKSCRFCGEGREIVEHLFFHFDQAKTIWKLTPVQWEGLDSPDITIKE